ncbi:hypothetical protein [Mesorhizobium sp.]|nr:hypothetical protein [Mesorhizobium sp.]
MVLAVKRDFPDLAPNDRKDRMIDKLEFFIALTKEEHFRPGSDNGGG